MKSFIVYYSYTGNTQKVAQVLAEVLKEKSEVEILRLEVKESKHFFIQAVRAFTHKKAKINPVNFDLKDYDLVCFGTPVWAFAPAPAMNTYLEKCYGLSQKKAVLFCTYGSGVGKDKCLDYMQDILTKKGVKDFWRFLIPQSKAKDRDLFLIIKETLRL